MPEHPISPDDRQEPLFDDFPPVSSEAWRARIVEDLKGASYEERLVWRPPEGFAVAPFYRAEDLREIPAGLPRRRRPGAGNAWRIRQDIPATGLVEANRLARAAAEGGADGLGFPLATDSGAGILIRTQDDLARLLTGIPLAITDVHLRSGAAARPLLAMLLNEAARRGFDAAALRGSVTDDPLARLARHGALAVATATDETRRLLEEAEAAGTSLHVLCVDARPYHQAGATAVQELAFTLSAASAYLVDLTERGCPVELVVQRLRLVMPVGTSYFMEIAKLRALRLLFAQLVSAFDEASQARPYVEAVTSRRHLTAYDPHANLLRATTEAAAAVIGGCDELTVRPFDEALHAPGDVSLRLARNIQHILRYEARLGAVADPGAGSYYLEVLTDQLARHAWALFQRVEALGGHLEALRQGFIQQEIGRVRAHREAAVAAGKRALIGVNRYPDADEERLDDLQPDPADAPPDPTLAFGVGLPPATLRARLRAGASLQDLAQQGDPGQVVRAEPLPRRRSPEPFEELRLRTERHAAAMGRRPVVFLLTFGDPVTANARAAFARNFFGCAGFSLLEHPTTASMEEGARAARERGPDIVVLCSADDEYAARVPALCQALRAADPHPLLVVAGYPEAHVEALQAAGVDAFIHRAAPLLDTLSRFQERLGMA